MSLWHFLRFHIHVKPHNISLPLSGSFHWALWPQSHARDHKQQDVLSSHGWTIFYWMRIYHIFFTHSSTDKTFWLFHVLDTVNNATMNMEVQRLLQDCFQFSLDKNSKSGITGSYGSNIFNFWRRHHTVCLRFQTHAHKIITNNNVKKIISCFFSTKFYGLRSYTEVFNSFLVDSVCGIRQGSSFILSGVDTQFSHTMCWRYYSNCNEDTTGTVTKTVVSPLNILGSSVINWLTKYAWVCFWALYSILLI